MSIEEVRAAFLGFYEKRLRLQLLDAELVALSESASAGYVADPDLVDSKYSIVTFEMQIIDSVVADTFPLTLSRAALLPALQALRQSVIVANNRARIFFSAVALPLSNPRPLIKEHNEFMRNSCLRIRELVELVRTELKPLLAP